VECAVVVKLVDLATVRLTEFFPFHLVYENGVSQPIGLL
jgi:hypothetical protein